jgi:hypothetical protein
MFRREPRTPKGLRQVAGGLQHIHDEPIPRLDLESVRKEMSRLIGQLSAVHSDEDIQKTINKYVDSFIHDWLREMLRWHHAALHALDLLDTQLARYLVQFAELNTDERGKLAEIEGVAAHIWDRVGEPDVPHIDPIR